MRLQAVRGLLVRGVHVAAGEVFEVDDREGRTVLSTGRAVVAPAEQDVAEESETRRPRGRPRKES